MANHARQNETIEKSTHQEHDPEDAASRRIEIGVPNQQDNDTMVWRKVVTPIAPSIVSSAMEYGPFASFVESLTLMLHFLFNHCKLGSIHG